MVPLSERSLVGDSQPENEVICRALVSDERVARGADASIRITGGAPLTYHCVVPWRTIYQRRVYLVGYSAHHR
jgi:hypothetical protein